MADVTQLSTEIKKFNLANPHAHMPPLEEISHHQPRTIELPSHELVSFRAMPKAKRDREAKDFFEQDFIREYLDKKWEDETYNRDSFYRIYDLFLANPGLKTQICAKLSQFRAVILRQSHTYEGLKIDFKQFPFEANEAEPQEEVEVGWDD